MVFATKARLFELARSLFPSSVLSPHPSASIFAVSTIDNLQRCSEQIMGTLHRRHLHRFTTLYLSMFLLFLNLDHLLHQRRNIKRQAMETPTSSKALREEAAHSAHMEVLWQTLRRRWDSRLGKQL
jgi:hypothetical protein